MTFLKVAGGGRSQTIIKKMTSQRTKPISELSCLIKLTFLVFYPFWQGILILDDNAFSNFKMSQHILVAVL